jgi:sugar-specific transcriptional regulator TrmB
VARNLWSTRNIIGHPSAPSGAAVSEDEAREMALAWARALADAATRSASPSVTTFISESRVGEILVEILQRIEQVLEAQRQMYQEYLELKRRQVELLQRGERRAAD